MFEIWHSNSDWGKSGNCSFSLEQLRSGDFDDYGLRDYLSDQEWEALIILLQSEWFSCCSFGSEDFGWSFGWSISVEKEL